MLFCNGSSEILIKILEDTFKKTKYNLNAVISLYKSGIISYVSNDLNKYIFDNGNKYLLSNSIPIYDKIEKKYEIDWIEYIIKDNLLKKKYIDKVKSIIKEGVEINEINNEINCNNIKIVFKNENFIGYTDNLFEMKFFAGNVKMGNKDIGIIFEINNENIDKIIKKLYENYKLIEIEDENIEKGIIKLFEKI